MAGFQYNEAFYAFHEETSRNSARETIPLVLRYVRPKSVVDVGCGIGTWLVEFEAAGIVDVVGLDGDYVERSKLLIDPRQFRACDLTLPLELDRQFDLAISLEVAEHLPPQCAAAFVASLTRLAPVVLFSAAIPHDAGAGHVNEQFPEYWQEKFRPHGFVVVDCLRRPLWNNDKVAPYYRQDMMFFVRRDRLAGYPLLAEEFARAGENPPLSFVHPQTYLTHYTTMMDKIRQSQCLAMRYAARLRAVNLVVFPDWTQPPEVVSAELGELIQALVTHPDGQSIALVVNVGGTDELIASGMIARLADEIIAAYRGAGGTGPEIASVGGQFGPNQWEVLMACMQWRAKLKYEDQQAIAIAKAQEFPLLTCDAIRAGTSLACPERLV